MAPPRTARPPRGRGQAAPDGSAAGPTGGRRGSSAARRVVARSAGRLRPGDGRARLAPLPLCGRGRLDEAEHRDPAAAHHRLRVPLGRAQARQELDGVDELPVGPAHGIPRGAGRAHHEAVVRREARRRPGRDLLAAGHPDEAAGVVPGPVVDAVQVGAHHLGVAGVPHLGRHRPRRARTTASGAKRASTAARSWAVQAALNTRANATRSGWGAAAARPASAPPTATAQASSVCAAHRRARRPAAPHPATCTALAGAYGPTSTRRVTWPVLSQ